MRTTRSLVLLLLFGIGFISPLVLASEAGAVIDDDDEYADPVVETEDLGLLVAHKRIKESKIVQGCNMTVSISLYNVGKGNAGSVSLEDKVPEDFDIIEGESTAKFGTLTPGGSVAMEYIMIPKAGNKRFLASPAIVKYTTSSQNTIRLLASTTPVIEVLSTRQNMELYAMEIGKFVSLGVLRTKRDWVSSGAVLSVAGTALCIYMLFSSLSRTREAARRRAAERELGVSEMKK